MYNNTEVQIVSDTIIIISYYLHLLQRSATLHNVNRMAIFT